MAHRGEHLNSTEIENKANAIVDAEERGEHWNVTGISPNSQIRLDARVAMERNTRSAIRRIHRGRMGKPLKSVKARKPEKARKSDKAKSRIRKSDRPRKTKFVN